MQSISKLATAGGLLRATLTHKPLKLSPISSILSTSYPANNKCSSPLAISRVRTFGGTRACNATINNTSSPGSSEAPQAPEPQNVICGVHLEEGLELTEYMMIAEKITLVLQSVVVRVEPPPKAAQVVLLLTKRSRRAKMLSPRRGRG